MLFTAIAAVGDSILDKFPWNFDMKWPITRGERIQELRTLNEYYGNTSQANNVKAAIAWHSKFSADELVPAPLVWFQDGAVKEESDVSEERGVIWTEVSRLPAFCCHIAAN